MHVQQFGHAVMSVCDHLRSVILLPYMMEVSFLPAILTRLVVSELKH